MKTTFITALSVMLMLSALTACTGGNQQNDQQATPAPATQQAPAPATQQAPAPTTQQVPTPTTHQTVTPGDTQTMPPPI
ncbi:MAG: hypothetical protein ACRESO_00310 [Gammaproteobacteria bacterium]